MRICVVIFLCYPLLGVGGSPSMSRTRNVRNVKELSCYYGGFRDCCETPPCGLVSGRRTTCHCDKSCYDNGDCCEDIGETCQETYNITVTKSGTPIAGEMYSLVCTVEVSPGSPNVTWMFDGKVVSTVGTVTVEGPETSGTTTVLTVTFDPLHTSHGGEYTCQSVVGRAQVKREVNETIIVGIPAPSVSLTREPSSGPIHYGDSLTLICTTVIDTAVGTGVLLAMEWTGPVELPYSTCPTMIANGTYQSMVRLFALQSSDSGVYTCTAIVSADGYSEFVGKEEDGFDEINITLELLVTISIDYIPPPDFNPKPGLNEFRAGSGPLTLTCHVEGANGTVNYIWDSSIAMLYYWGPSLYSVGGVPEQRTISRLELAHNGTQTCTATDSYNNSGSASIEINVVGAGLWQYGSSQSLPNNGIVLSVTSLELLCISSFAAADGYQFVDLYSITRIAASACISLLPTPVYVCTFGTNWPGVLWLYNYDLLTPADQGVYTCRMPDVTGNVLDLNFGFYPPGFNAPPTITSLIYNSGNRTLTCISTDSPATNVTWTKDGDTLTVDGTVYSMIQTVTDRRAATYENVLTLPAESDIWGVYNCTVKNTFGATSATTTVPEVIIEVSGSPTVGQSLTLTCSTTTQPASLSFERLTLRNPFGSIIKSGVGQSLSHSFTSLQVSDSGEYGCDVAIVSSYTNRSLTVTKTHNVVVQIPPPRVSTSHDAIGGIFTSSIVTLTCTIQLDTTLVNMLGDLSVSSTWITPSGTALASTSRITVSETSHISGTTYFSRVVFDTVHASDTGDYTCQVSVSLRTPSVYVTQGEGSDTVRVTVQFPSIQISAHPNTTRLPIMSPFSTVCTVTIPDGVVTNKRIQWKQRSGSFGLIDIMDNDGSIQIVYSDLDQPVSSSVLTVQENSAGQYHYYCQVNIDELDGIEMKEDVHPIDVIGPSQPYGPTYLKNASTGIHSSIIQWTVPLIAFTPETYVVHYGTNMDSLDSASDPVESGDDFASLNQVFHVEITGLTPGTVYYYQVVSTNTEGKTVSAIHSLTTNPSYEHFQLQLPMEHCTAWSPAKYDQVLEGIQNAVLQVVSDSCKCIFTMEFLSEGEFSCQTTPTHVTYRSTINGTSTHSAPQLLDFIKDWVSSDPAIRIGPLRVSINSTCTVQINSMTDPECPAPNDVLQEILSLNKQILSHLLESGK